ncbi:MAG: DMT family transporter [Deltaproteobacteria bacterium]
MKIEILYIAAAAALYGTITVGGQFFLDSGLSLFEASFLRVSLIALTVLPAALIRREYLIRRERVPFFAVFGLIGASLVLTQFGGIALGTPVAVAAFLLYTQPVWTIFLSKFLLGEAITSRKIIAALVALLGVGALVGLGGGDCDSCSAAGVVCSLFGGLFLSLWVIWGRKSAIAGEHQVTATLGWTAFSALWMMALFPVLRGLIADERMISLSLDFPAETWGYLLVFALIGGVIAHLLFYRGIRGVCASTAGVILLLEPASAAVIAALWFSQPIGAGVIAGGSLILISNYLVVTERV